jgi:hypothetical protein
LLESSLTTTLHIDVYRVKYPECGVKIGESAAVAEQGPVSQGFEETVGQACESEAARPVARRFGLAEKTVRAIEPAVCSQKPTCPEFNG